MPITQGISRLHKDKEAGGDRFSTGRIGDSGTVEAALVLEVFFCLFILF